MAGYGKEIKMNTWGWTLTAEEQELVEKNLGLVKRIVRMRFGRVYNVEKDDLIQTGNLGLMSAAHFYSIRRQAGEIIDCNFSTFAWSRISAYISDFLRDRNVNRKLGTAIKGFVDQAYMIKGIRIDLSEVAVVFDMPEKLIRAALTEHTNFENLDDVLDAEPDSLVFVDDKPSPLDQVMIADEMQNEKRKIIRRRLEKLARLRIRQDGRFRLPRAVWELP